MPVTRVNIGQYRRRAERSAGGQTAVGSCRLCASSSLFPLRRVLQALCLVLTAMVLQALCLVLTVPAAQGPAGSASSSLFPLRRVLQALCLVLTAAVLQALCLVLAVPAAQVLQALLLVPHSCPASLEFLYLGGNLISYIPPELAHLPHLSCLVLCDNRIQSVPPQLAHLQTEVTLAAVAQPPHNNLLTYLPREILSLIRLQELSLRGNPLVVRFVRDLTYMPPTLLELAGRTIKSRGIPYNPWELPENLLRYLDLASKCPNPKCGGENRTNNLLHCLCIEVYRELQQNSECSSGACTLTAACVTLSLWTFCGKYRLPLMHYLCSPECSSPCSSVSSQSESDSEDEASVAAAGCRKCFWAELPPGLVSEASVDRWPVSSVTRWSRRCECARSRSRCRVPPLLLHLCGLWTLALYWSVLPVAALVGPVRQQSHPDVL
ncbi:unnamed protein product [Ranitomeya imitator]|uniref:Leucine-rich repeat-containing protein 58 n=1 Tax=Ranitomeya imitator TaxID=111125 RepID=A0ABN9LAW5_9NEOB|nr:unnamed protein product [Ranitomeya imitator]